MKNNKCFITFPCLYSKIETKPKICVFWNKATKGTATPSSRERKEQCRIAKILPSLRFSVNKIFFVFKIILCCLKMTT